MTKITAVCIVILLFHPIDAAFMKNRYKVEIESVEICPNRNPGNIRNLTYKHYNRTHKSLSYDFSYIKPLDEKIAGQMTVDRWGDGGWINIPFLTQKPFICKFFLKAFPQQWINLHRKIGIPHPDRCPIPAGNYSLRDYSIENTEFNLPFFSGRFRTTVTFYEDDDAKELIHCILTISQITELF